MPLLRRTSDLWLARRGAAMLGEHDRFEALGGVGQVVLAVDDEVIVRGRLGHLALGVEQAQRALLRRVLVALVDALHQIA